MWKFVFLTRNRGLKIDHCKFRNYRTEKLYYYSLLLFMSLLFLPNCLMADVRRPLVCKGMYV